ncbi:MAG TPA: glutaredoxin domain-containing protein [Oligoflexia bacterium]|nr:glutaredoxin domain-containing protein [Oligoflexia bacterium]HMR25052.1 glutaredoxin domain-containing protein [Oligoflexia bacterium]
MSYTKTAVMISTQVCPFCVKAKAMLTDHGYDIIEIKAGQDIPMDAILPLSGRTSVPQIYIDGQHIGGSDDLEVWLENQAKQ